MLDRHLHPVIGRALAPAARRLAWLGADRITLAGFTAGLLAVPMLAAGWYLAALGCLALNRVLDGLDGAVARLNGPTPRGAFLDVALDFFFYATVPFGFALADPAANALPAAALLLGFVGTGSSFLAFAAIAAQRGLRAQDYPDKGLFYLGGLTEGAETVAVFAAMCLWPAAFPWLAWGFAALCGLTTLSRWVAGWRSFG